MVRKIRELFLKYRTKGVPDNKQGKQMAKFMDRAPSYVTGISRKSGGKRMVDIKPGMFILQAAEGWQASKKQTQGVRIFQLLCWFIVRESDKFQLTLDLQAWLNVKGNPLDFGGVVASNAIRVDRYWASVGDNGIRISHATADEDRSHKKVAELPGFDDDSAQEKDAPTENGTQVTGSESLPPTGYPVSGNHTDIPVELWVKMVQHLKLDAEAHGGLFSITAAYTRFEDKLTGAKQPMEFLRRNDAKEQIELLAKVKEQGEIVIPKGTNKVTDIPNIPEVICNDDIRGWCVCEALFLDYAMFLSREFKLVALDILRQAATGAVPQAPAPQPATDPALLKLLTQLTEAQVAQNKQLQAHTDAVENRLAKVEGATRVLKASQDFNRNGYIHSTGYTPLGFYAKSTITDALHAVIDAEFVGVTTITEAAAGKLVEYHALFSTYLERWMHTVPKDPSLGYDPQTGIVPLDKLTTISDTAEHRPILVPGGVKGVGHSTYYMCTTAARTQYHKRENTGTEYKTYYTTSAFGLALSSLLPRAVYKSAKIVHAPNMPLWVTATKSKGTALDPEIFKFLEELVADEVRMTEFITKLETKCQELTAHQVESKRDPWGIGAQRLKWYNQRKKNQRIANEYNGKDNGTETNQ